MNQKSRIMGITGIAVAGVIAACAALFSAPSASHASPEPSWHRLDSTAIFLHDLTSSPATLAAAMCMNADGTVSGELTTLHELRYLPSPEGIVAARSRDAVALGDPVEGMVFFNPSSEAVMAYFEVGGTMREIKLLPGEGVAIGELNARIAAQTQRGCRCICAGVHPETGEPVQEIIFVACRVAVVNAEDGEPCDCSGINDQNCWPANPVHPDYDGKTRECGTGFIPVSKHRHR